MKSKHIILATVALISLGSFAQKEQIKAAEKAFKNENPTEALSILKQAETSLTVATASEKAQYNFVKGNVLSALAAKNGIDSKNEFEAGKAYLEVIEIEKASGKSKYTSEAQMALTSIKSKLINNAIEEGTKKNYATASTKLKEVFDLDKTDLEKLYYAANYAINAQDYDTALAYYEELKKLNFSGESIAYYAKSVITDQEEYFSSKEDRDTKVRLKLNSDARDEKIPSKRGEIYKNIALILVQKNKIQEAKTALAEARVANPDDTSLTLAEADLYLKLEDFVTYKKLITEVLEKSPNDADLVYNLGVISSKTNSVEAEKYYKRAIEIKPDYINAYLNLAILKLDADKKIFEEMNKLGNSEKDNKRYEVLKKQREAIFTGALPYLEKANELNPENEEVRTTLLNVYGALEMTEKKKALKAKATNK